MACEILFMIFLIYYIIEEILEVTRENTYRFTSLVYFAPGFESLNCSMSPRNVACSVDVGDGKSRQSEAPVKCFLPPAQNRHGMLFQRCSRQTSSIQYSVCASRIQESSAEEGGGGVCVWNSPRQVMGGPVMSSSG